MFRKLAVSLMVCALALPLAFAQKPVPTKRKPDAPKTMSTKKMPPRDAKGRFIKKVEPAKTASGKKMPPRDAKGRFIKTSKSKDAPKK